MADLIQPVKNGIMEQKKSISAETSTGNNALGKDAFLQLLVTQLKYQEPLNPSTDTEFIAQLATFTQLEQLQNLTAATTSSQAFSLVGKNVVLNTKSSTGEASTISGRVDFVSMNKGKAYLSVGGELYSADQLDSVIADDYIIEKGLPGIEGKTKLEYDAEKPMDVSFQVNLGGGSTVSDQVAVMINGELLDTSLVSLSGNKVTIDKQAFEKLENGNYAVAVIFNDPYLTTVTDKVSLKVSNSTYTAPPEEEVPEDGKETEPEEPEIEE